MEIYLAFSRVLLASGSRVLGVLYTWYGNFFFCGVFLCPCQLSGTGVCGVCVLCLCHLQGAGSISFSRVLGRRQQGVEYLPQGIWTTYYYCVLLLQLVYLSVCIMCIMYSSQL